MSTTGPLRIPSMNPRQRGAKGLRPRIKYQPYAHEKKWFKIKKRKTKVTEEQPQDEHYVFDAFCTAVYQPPRTCDLVFEGS